MSKFFSSDLHLGHPGVLKWSDRPFNTLEEMSEVILDNCLSVMRKGDMFYILGDLSFDKVLAEGFLKEVTKRGIEIHFIKGNHDKSTNGDLYKWGCKTISDIKIVKEKGEYLVLCHYPMLSFPMSHYGAWHLYGHHHKNTPDPTFLQGKRLNVNVEFHNYKPWSFDEIKEYMGNQPNSWDFIPKGERKND